MTVRPREGLRSGARSRSARWCVVVLVIALTGLAGCGVTDDQAVPLTSVPQLPDPIRVSPADGELRLLYLGDSITRGSGASSYAESFREVTTATLRASTDVDEQEVAKGGARLSEIARIATPIAIADIVVVQLGTNDLLSPPTPAEVFANQYRTLLMAVRAANPGSAVLCLGVWRQPASAEPFDSAIRDECVSERSRFLPMSDLFAEDEFRGPDGRVALGEGGRSDNFHPNDLGHRAIANRIVGVLRLERPAGT